MEARSGWLVSFMIDLKPYELLLDKLGSELLKLGTEGVEVTQNSTRDGRYFR